MADDHRSISLSRLDTGVYLARNPRGGTLTFGSMAGDAFTPVELLLAAIGGCTAVDVDVVTGRRAAPETFDVVVSADKIRDEGGNILKDIEVTFRVTFPDGEAGDAARQILPRCVATSHDKTCTVSRTVEAGTPVHVSIE
jgi:uncharacterized OsmC-like protein